MINSVVIFGGESCEHDISIVTGGQVINKLDAYLYNIIPIYIDKKGIWWTGDSLKDIDNFPGRLEKLKRVSFIPGSNALYQEKNKRFVKLIDVDFAYLCLHGLNGEDGSVASICELSHIAYSSAGIMASSLCLDKCVFKLICKSLDIKVVDGVSIDSHEFEINTKNVINKISKLSFPVIFKPARQGSSVGIVVCDDVESIEKCLKEAFKFDDRILVEKYVDIQKEINIAVFDNKGTLVFSETEEPVYNDKILSFDDKYLKNPNGFEGISRIMPASISEDMQNEIKDIVEKLYRTLNLFGVVRFDFILSKKGELYINEINTIPGSMANYLFDKINFQELLDLLRSAGVYRFEKSKNIAREFKSKFLESGKNFIKK